ncbi:MAG: damage-inducible protein DinB [Luteitalea sp.]|nr:damage-inducible protein DinB [Luteitalea sp.]
MVDHFRMLARYNRVANERLYDACAALSDGEYRRERPGSFGSIHRLLNHLLLGDRIWMDRFHGQGAETPPLGAILFDELVDLRSARVREDDRIIRFFDALDEGFLARSLDYVNYLGRHYVDEVPVAVAHFFNHQAHHRGQVHVMLSQASIAPPNLDLHRIINP